jgi:hypothetical protein
MACNSDSVMQVTTSANNDTGNNSIQSTSVSRKIWSVMIGVTSDLNPHMHYRGFVMTAY